MDYRKFATFLLLIGLLFNVTHTSGQSFLKTAYKRPWEAFFVGFLARALSHYIAELTAHQIINDRWLTKDAEEKYEWLKRTYPSIEASVAQSLPLVTNLISLGQAVYMWVLAKQWYIYLRSIPGRQHEKMSQAYDGGMAAYLIFVAFLSLWKGLDSLKISGEIAKASTAFIVALFAHYCSFVGVGTAAAQQVRRDEYLPTMAFFIVGTIASFLAERGFFALGALEPCKSCRTVYHSGSDAAFAGWWAIPDIMKFSRA